MEISAADEEIKEARVRGLPVVSHRSSLSWEQRVSDPLKKKPESPTLLRYGSTHVLTGQLTPVSVRKSHVLQFGCLPFRSRSHEAVVVPSF